MKNLELRLILRGALAGALAGILGFVFARIFAEPVINRAIDYESGRDDWLDKLNQAAGLATAPDGPEIFSRTIQSTVGIATGIIGFGIAMGALVSVVYIVLHGRIGLRPRQIVWMIAGFGFLGIYLLPFAKYPANPPAIGHDFTIVRRAQLYLVMVGCSLLLMIAAAAIARQLTHRGMSPLKALLITVVGFFVVYGVLVAVLPSLGDLQANKDAVTQFGFAGGSTETPQPITNILNHALTVDGKSIAPGQIVYPGFSADDLWKFRWYSLLNQVLIWTSIGLLFGYLVERVVGTRRPAWAERAVGTSRTASVAAATDTTASASTAVDEPVATKR